MPSDTHTARRDNTSTRSSRTDESELCRSYFAHAGDYAVRYGVGFDQVLAHLYAARAAHRRRTLPRVRYIDDLVHAVACVRDADLAWWDLTDQHERALIRVCRQWLEPTDAIVFVRRLLTAVRRDDGDVRSLRSFDGTRTMRQWLADRIVDRMKQQRACGLQGSVLRRPTPPAAGPWDPPVRGHSSGASG